MNQTRTALSDSTRAFLLDELGGTGFSSPEAVHYVQETATTLHTCSYPAQRLVLHWVLGNRSSYPIPMVQKVCRRAATLVEWLNIQQPLVFWLIPAPGPRRLPRQGEVLRERNINGGFTYTSNGHVFVYRAEELPKVVLHELLHHSRYHTEPWDPTSLRLLYDHLRVDPSTRLLPNETIVELWAEHFHIGFLSQETGIPYARLWEAEQRHAQRQARRLLVHYRGVPGPLWRETTHGMSYLILRAAMFPYFHERLVPMPTPYDPRRLTGLLLEAFQAWAQNQARRVSGPQQDRKRGLRMTQMGDF